MMRLVTGLASIAVVLASIASFGTLVGCSERGGRQGQGSALENAEPLRQVELEAQSKLRIESRNTNEIWLNEKAVTGDARVVAGRFALEGEPSDGSLVLSAGRILEDYVADLNIDLVGEIETWTPSTNNTDFDGHLAEVARIVTVEGFVLAETDANLDPVRDQMKALVDILGVKDDLTLIRSSSYTLLESGPGGLLRVSLGLSVNRKTGEFVGFLSRQGWEPTDEEVEQTKPDLSAGPVSPSARP